MEKPFHNKIRAATFFADMGNGGFASDQAQIILYMGKTERNFL
jgi:hypothetical protein